MSQKAYTFDERREIIVPGSYEETLNYAVANWIQIAQESLKKHGAYFVALSGGSTPNAIFRKLASNPIAQKLPWEKIHLFWSDERSVPPDHSENNYKMAMEAGLNLLPLVSKNVHRMCAEKDIQENAIAYEHLIKETLLGAPFDLIMLGMGEDGHTASLFPHTEGLHIQDRLVIANYVPQKQTWRMSFTYPMIHHTRHLCIYALGATKAEIIKTVLADAYQPNEYPIQSVGSQTCKATWILDEASFKTLKEVIHE